MLGFAASLLTAPAIVRATSLMPVKRLIPALPCEPLASVRPWAGFVERLMYNALAGQLASERITVVINGRIPTLEKAEAMVRHARLNGWIVEKLARPAFRPQPIRHDVRGPLA